jgi:hypothetical protein
VLHRDPILSDRHELNSSPALSRTGVYIGSEDGHLTYVPYDYCLRRADARCNTQPGAPYPGDLSRVLPVTSGGVVHLSGSEGPVPASSEITGRLLVRQGGSTTYASMLPDSLSSSLVHTDPAFDFSSQLSGDGRFVFITPNAFLSPNTTYRVTVGGTWGANGVRTANWTAPGTWTKYGNFSDTFSFRTGSYGPRMPLKVTPRSVSTFELRRLAVPLPAFLPSVNQIGFDSYVLLVAPVAMTAPDASGQGQILLWAVQARRTADGRYLADPSGTLVFPLAGHYRGSTLLLSVSNAVLTFSFGTVPLRRLDMDFQLTPKLYNRPGASLYAEAVCAEIPNYGPATYLTGLCNAEGILAAAGTFITRPYPASGAAGRPPRGVSIGTVSLQQPAPSAGGSVTATLSLRPGVRYPAADHRLSVLLVDDSGTPLGIDYTQQTTTTDAHGNLVGIKLSIPAGTVMPSHLKAYVITDVFPLGVRTLY